MKRIRMMRKMTTLRFILGGYAEIEGCVEGRVVAMRSVERMWFEVVVELHCR